MMMKKKNKKIDIYIYKERERERRKKERNKERKKKERKKEEEEREVLILFSNMASTIKILINHQDITVSGKSKAVEPLPHHPKMLGSSLVSEGRRKGKNFQDEQPGACTINFLLP